MGGTAMGKGSHLALTAASGVCDSAPTGGSGLARWAPAGDQRSAISHAQLVEQAVQLVERAEGDRHLALLAASGAAVDADLDLRGQRVGQLLFQPHDVA